ncbi:MAG: DUF4129 domain-containing protein [Planctomycetaceae bacterium]|nr:DUF4129 domain-containing protein [Planctomycetaceae bacterium]
MSGMLGLLASMPDETALRDKVREVLSRPDYQTERSASESLWILELIFKVLEWVIKPLRWLFELTEGLPSFLRWVIVAVLVVVLVALLVHIFYTLFRALGGEQRQPPSHEIAQSPLTTAKEWERLADDAAERGEWIAAVRHLFRACLARLEERERRPFRRGTTNRGHLRRYRNAPFCESLEVLVITIERKWYGDEACEAKDYEACRQAHSNVTASVIGGTPC